jgi:asparagine synthase (glutamine-hydrolysing)
VLESVEYSNADERYTHWLASFSPELREELFQGELLEFERAYDSAEIYRRSFADGGTDAVNRLLRVDMKTWLPDTYLEKVDKATMAVGLEARVPLLDHLIIEYVFSLPGACKISRFRKKFLLRAAASGLVPKSVLTKPKHGFSVPLDEWFRGPLTSYSRDILLDGQLESRGYFRRTAIERLLERHQQRESDYGSHIWQLLNFELWHRLYVDAARIPRERLESSVRTKHVPNKLGASQKNGHIAESR